MTSSTTTTDPTAPGSAETTPFARSVLGIVVFSRTIAAVRYAKDAGKAPALDARLALLRMSADAVASCEEARRLGASAGIDPDEAAASYMGALGEVDRVLGKSRFASLRLLGGDTTVSATFIKGRRQGVGLEAESCQAVLDVRGDSRQ